MKYRHLLHAALLLTVTAFASCANEDVAQDENKQSQNATNAPVVMFTGERDIAQVSPTSRTTIKHALGQGATPYWSTGDKIWVKDTNGTFKQSNAGTFNSAMKDGVFAVSGTFANGCTVHYTGSNGTAGDKVTIAAKQNQTAANDFSHAGSSGDCGVATASGNGNSFKFKLNHKASYLCFLPCTTNAFVKRSKLTSIEVVAESDIAGTFDFSNGSLSAQPVANGSKKITLVTGNGFDLTNENTSLATNGAYVVIPPGTHHLTVRYWLENKVDNPEGRIVGTVTKYIDITCEAGKIYDITANLNPADVSGEYFMWDAKKHYWYKREGSQPKISGASTTNFPQSQADSPESWYNSPANGTNWAANSANQSASVNQVIWYVQKGAPHWDAAELWTLFGHLYKGGMWLKKQDVIARENHTTTQNMYASYNGIDYRQSTSTFPDYSFNNNNIVKERPTKSEISDYFYLPAKGFYLGGKMQFITYLGYYWSATCLKADAQRAFSLTFNPSSISLGSNFRFSGFAVDLKW